MNAHKSQQDFCLNSRINFASEAAKNKQFALNNNNHVLNRINSPSKCLIQDHFNENGTSLQNDVSPMQISSQTFTPCPEFTEKVLLTPMKSAQLNESGECLHKLKSSTNDLNQLEVSKARSQIVEQTADFISITCELKCDVPTTKSIKYFEKLWKLPICNLDISEEDKESRVRISCSMASKKVNSKYKVIAKHRHCAIAFHEFKNLKIRENYYLIDEIMKILVESVNKSNDINDHAAWQQLQISIKTQPYIHNEKKYVSIDAVNQLNVPIDPAVLLKSNVGDLVPLDYLTSLGIQVFS